MPWIARVGPLTLGLIPMAAFLTKNSPGPRTSPVKRGYWVVRRVLGETIPPPLALRFFRAGARRLRPSRREAH